VYTPGLIILFIAEYKGIFLLIKARQKQKDEDQIYFFICESCKNVLKGESGLLKNGNMLERRIY
jgi:hypothetical protein